MANAHQRRRRRKRRLARIKYPGHQRFRTQCVAPDGTSKHHWIYLTRKGDILFRDHPGVDLKSMAAEGMLRDDCPGCFWAAVRLLYNLETVRSHFALQRLENVHNRDDKQLSTGFYYHMHNVVDTLRGTRLLTLNTKQRSEMKPFLESIVYRRDLVKRRREYWIDALSIRIQQRVLGMTEDAWIRDKESGAPKLDVGIAGQPFAMFNSYYGYGTPPDTPIWDY